MVELYIGKPCKRGHGGERYRSTNSCVECQKLLRAKHDANNREKRLAQKSAWQADNYSVATSNQQKWRAENKERYADTRREWARNNRGLVNAQNAKRRAARRNATPPWLTKEHIEEMKQFYINCPKGYEVDHIHPLQGKNSCGLHVPWNLQYLTMMENRKKSNR